MQFLLLLWLFKSVRNSFMFINAVDSISLEMYIEFLNLLHKIDFFFFFISEICPSYTYIFFCHIFSCIFVHNFFNILILV